MGKTFLTKGIIGNFLNYRISVKSPTFSFIEIYYSYKGNICHFDFYRLSNVNKLIEIDFNNYLNENYFLIIEWGNIIFDKFYLSNINIYIFYYSNFFNRLFILKSKFFNFKLLFGK